MADLEALRAAIVTAQRLQAEDNANQEQLILEVSHDRCAELNGLKDTLQSLRAEIEASQKKRESEKVEHTKVLGELTRQRQAINAHNLATTSALAETEVKIEILMKKEEDQAQLRAKRSQKKDITLLPTLLLRRVVSYLDPCELVTALLACHRWHETLNNGILWKGLAVAQWHTNEKVRRDLSGTANSISDHPRSLSVTINDIKSKKKKYGTSTSNVLPKNLMFQICLDHVQSQVIQQYSMKDDLAQKVRTEQEVMKFLQEQVESNRDRIGGMAFEKEAWLKKHADMSASKDQIAREIAEQEADLAAEVEARADIVKKREDGLKEVEHRMHVLQDVNDHVGDDGIVDEKAIKDLKMQRKVLRKGVKAIQQELLQVQQEKEVFDSKLAEMKQFFSQIKM